MLARQFGINPKTIPKWPKRADVHDSPMGPEKVRSTVLTPLEQAVIVAFRKQTLLPPDDVLVTLQPQIPGHRRVRRSIQAAQAPGAATVQRFLAAEHYLGDLIA